MFAVEHGESDAKDLSRAFMDKTFDVTFDVPEPVMSDWQDYLAAQLTQCFGGLINEADVYWATRFLDDKRRAKGALVTTPRSINKFVNQIAALYSQRPSTEVEIPTLAYHAAFSQLMEKGLLEFFQEKATPSVPPAANWQVQLAAIRYGVPLPKARQILLTDPIRDAVADLDYAAFKDLIAVPGFSTELIRVLLNPPSAESGHASFGFVTNAALLVDKEITSSEHWLAEAWRAILERYCDSSSPTTPPPDLETRLATVFSHAPADLRSLFVQRSSSKIARMMQTTSISSPSIGPAFTAADQLVRDASSADVDAPQFDVGLDPPQLLALINKAVSKPNVWRHLRSKHKLSDLVAVLEQWLRQGTELQTVTAVVKILLDASFSVVPKGKEDDWNPLIAASNDLLRSQNGSLPQVGAAATVLGTLQPRSANAAATLKALIDEGHITNRTYEAGTTGLQMLSAGYALLICRGGDFGPPAGTSWTSLFESNADIGEETSLRIMEFFGPVVVPTIWASLERAPSGQPLIMAVIDHLLSTGLGNLNVDQTMEAIATYLKPLSPQQQRQFVSKVMKYPGFWQNVPSIKQDSTFLHVARLVNPAATGQRTELTSVVRGRLAQASSSAWAAAIENGGPLYVICSTFSADLPPWPLKSPAFEGLIAEIQSVANSQNRFLMKRWFSVQGQLTPSAQQKALEALAQYISAGGYVRDLLALVKESSGKLLEPAVLKPPAVVRSVIVPLIETGPGRKWVQKNFPLLKPALSKAPRDVIAGLRNEVDRLARSGSKGRRDDAAALRALFGMK
jgi:hypothetical protein